MKQGIASVDANKKVTVIMKETEAIDYALSSAPKGSFIVITSDVIPDALEQVKRAKAKEDGVLID
jgi:cyanophycin synthetase